MKSHTILGGKVRLYRRENSSYWQCEAHVNGKRRKSTKTDSLTQAQEIAEDWYLELRGKSRAGILQPREKTFKDAAKQFEREYSVITQGLRSPRYIDGHKIRIRLHLNPFLGDMPLAQITAGTVQEYRIHRISTAQSGKAPARSTLHDEVVTIRQVLKTAVRHNWITAIPDLSPPYSTQGKVVHRPWFSPEEYKQLYNASGHYAKICGPRHRWNAEQVHDFILFMANTGLRPDEAKNLQHRDVSIVVDGDTDETILLIDVRGKRGVGYCKSLPGAVRPYERLLGRAKPSSKEIKTETYPLPSDPVFPGDHKKLFNGILKRADLKFDRDGNRRTAYSLRHTYICMRLMDGADIYQVAKNCRTSVEMIEKYYAAHIRTAIDASFINVRKKKPRRHGKPARKTNS